MNILNTLVLVMTYTLVLRMTEEQKPNTSTNQETDLILDTLVGMTIHRVELPVTLNVKGTIVTGIAVSLEQYLEGVAKEFESATGSPEITSAFAQGFRNIKNMVPSQANSDDGARTPLRYIHLKNAKFVVGNNLIPSSSVYWRGRLDQIDGFYLGTWS